MAREAVVAPNSPTIRLALLVALFFMYTETILKPSQVMWLVSPVIDGWSMAPVAPF